MDNQPEQPDNQNPFTPNPSSEFPPAEQVPAPSPATTRSVPFTPLLTQEQALATPLQPEPAVIPVEQPEEVNEPNPTLVDNTGTTVQDDTEEESEVAEFAPGVINWTAAEYVEHDKGHRWYAVLAAAAVILIVGAVFLLHDWIFAILIAVMAMTVIVITRRPAREISYQLDASGITVGEKHFMFTDFRAFGVVKEGAIYNLRLIPNKRFMPVVTAYIPNDQGERIIDVFGAVLPMEEIQPDIIDRLVAKSRI